VAASRSNRTAAISGSACPQTLTFISGNPASLVQRIELGQGTLQPINFFVSADGSQLYVVAAGHASVLVYNFAAGAVTSGIELLGNAIPLSADMSADAGTILVAGSDGHACQDIGRYDRWVRPTLSAAGA